MWSPYDDDDIVTEQLTSSLDRLGDDAVFDNVLSFVSKIQKAVLPGADKIEEITKTAVDLSDEERRSVEMLTRDVKYIKSNIDRLKSSVNCSRADLLLHYLIEAAEQRKEEDFTTVVVNRKKLLQIVAKLKLWVPPQRPDDFSALASAAKKEESPFISSKEKDNAATEIVKELVGLRCRQWGLDGLDNSYNELTDTLKNCLLCFSVFKCDAGKDWKSGVLIQKSLRIKKRIMIHWWFAEGLIDLYLNEINSKDASNPNPNFPPNGNQEIPNHVVSHSQHLRNEKKTIEEIGEEILKILAREGFVEPVMKKGLESGTFQMHPYVHSFVTALAKRAGFFDFSDKDGQLTPSFRLSQRACLVKSKDKLSSCQQWATYIDDRNKLKRFGEVQTLFNVNESMIDIKPEWFSKMQNLRVLHLGSWRSDPVEHIEVEDQKFLEDLNMMKQLRLFSLQGLSTIMKLTDSICALTNLIILDLKECHNLEELPSEIGSLKNLTHLDITNCHLLTKLPIGISMLAKLEVLKGFVIYGQASDVEVEKLCGWWRKTKGCFIHDVLRCKNKEVCALQDLVKLTKLRKLSLVVNRDDFPSEDEVQVFRDMGALYNLKISWEKSFKEAGDNNKALEVSSRKSWMCFPCTGPRNVCCCKPKEQVKSCEFLDRIKKLELWCFPHREAPNWLHPRQLKNLEKLYIKGGSLETLPGDTDKHKWVGVKALRLKYLPNIEILWLELKAMFPNMTYLEKYECKKLPFFPCDMEGVWTW